MFSPNNSKPSYTPVTVGSMAFSSKNGSPKINYFTPTPPASPSVKNPDSYGQHSHSHNNHHGQQNTKSEKVSKINDFIDKIKESLSSKNLEIFDTFWYQNEAYLMCIYNNSLPVSLIIENDVVFEDVILNYLNEPPKDTFIIDTLTLTNEDNFLEKTIFGICIKLGEKKVYLKFVNELDPENYELRHSIVPLITLNQIDQISDLNLEKRYETILNMRMKITSSSINNVSLKLQTFNYNTFYAFSNDYIINVEQIIKKILSLKRDKKSIMDNIEYYNMNKINIPQKDIENLNRINSKLINYYAYYEKYLSYTIQANKISQLITEANDYFQLINKDLLS